MKKQTLKKETQVNNQLQVAMSVMKKQTYYKETNKHDDFSWVDQGRFLPGDRIK